MTGEVKHDAPGHEAVTTLTHPGEQGEPDPHTRGPAIQPEGEDINIECERSKEDL